MATETLTLGKTTGSERGRLNIVGRSELVSAVAELARMVGGLPEAEQVMRLIADRLRATKGEMGRESQILDAMLPPIETLTDVTTTQLRWNALARDEALREFGALTSAQLAELRGAPVTNPHSATSRWLTANRAFAIETSAGRLFPAFQFEQGAPRPVISRVLQALGGQLRGWELLAWFTGSNGYLDGARPVDRLAEAPDDVVAAAAYQASFSED
jgi:hypothetical protein